MADSNDQQMFDPNQVEAIRRRSACLDFMDQVAQRGNGIHPWDAQVLTQRVGNLYRILPVHNTTPQEIGEKFEEDRYEFKRRVEDLDSLREIDVDEYAWRIWKENEEFIEKCTTFMNDTLFVKAGRKRKVPTEGAGYE